MQDSRIVQVTEAVIAGTTICGVLVIIVKVSVESVSVGEAKWQFTVTALLNPILASGLSTLKVISFNVLVMLIV